MSTFKEGFIKYGQDHDYIKPKKETRDLQRAAGADGKEHCSRYHRTKNTYLR